MGITAMNGHTSQGFWVCVKTAYTRAGDYHSPASRAELWSFVLFALVANALCGGLVWGMNRIDDEEILYYVNYLNDDALYYAILGVWCAFGVVTLMALAALVVRRSRARHEQD